MINEQCQQELVVNWHITEACNYSCKYCFAKWSSKHEREMLHHPHQVAGLLRAITRLPNFINQQQGSRFTSLRLNLVGGETFLYAQALTDIVQQAKQLGMRLSAITNGSLLNQTWLDVIAADFDSIGFSVDSMNKAVNQKLGRSSKGEVLDLNALIEAVVYLRTNNPRIDIKLNTVVNELNYQESLHDLLDAIKPNKWKVFKMLPILNQHYSISQA